MGNGCVKLTTSNENERHADVVVETFLVPGESGPVTGNQRPATNGQQPDIASCEIAGWEAQRPAIWLLYIPTLAYWDQGPAHYPCFGINGGVEIVQSGGMKERLDRLLIKFPNIESIAPIWHRSPTSQQSSTGWVGN